MISIEKAQSIIKKYIPDCTIEQIISHKGKYIICAPTSDPLEGRMDPFYSIDMKTGKLEGFSIFDPKNASAVEALAANNKSRQRS